MGTWERSLKHPELSEFVRSIGIYGVNITGFISNILTALYKNLKIFPYKFQLNENAKALFSYYTPIRKAQMFVSRSSMGQAVV